MFLNTKKFKAPKESAQTLEYGFGQGVSSAFSQQIIENPLTQLGRAAQVRQAANDGDPKIAPDQLYAEFTNEGLTFDEPMTRKQATLLNNWKGAENHLMDISSNAKGGAAQFTAQMATRIGASMLDPLNVGLSMIPVAGGANYAKVLGTAGKSTMNRLAFRAARGAKEGLVGGIGVAGITYAAAQETQLHYGATNFFMDVSLGTLMGASLRGGGGFVGDALKSMSPVTRGDLQRAVLNRAYTGDDFNGLETLALQDTHFAEAEIFFGRQFDNLDEGAQGVRDFAAYKQRQGEYADFIADLEKMNDASPNSISDRDLVQAIADLKKAAQKNGDQSGVPSFNSYKLTTDGDKLKGHAFAALKSRETVLKYRKILASKKTGELTSKGKAALQDVSKDLSNPQTIEFLKADMRNLIAEAKMVARASDMTDAQKHSRITSLTKDAADILKILGDDRIPANRMDAKFTEKMGFSLLPEAKELDLIKAAEGAQSPKALARQQEMAKQLAAFRAFNAAKVRGGGLTPPQVKRLNELSEILAKEQEKITGKSEAIPKLEGPPKTSDELLNSKTKTADIIKKSIGDEPDPQIRAALDEFNGTLKAMETRKRLNDEVLECMMKGAL